MSSFQPPSNFVRDDVIEKSVLPKVIEFQVTINLERGLHMRPATALFQVIKDLDCGIEVKASEGPAYDAKSVLNLILLVAQKGHTLNFCCSGPASAEAQRIIQELVAGDFGERV